MSHFWKIARTVAVCLVILGSEKQAFGYDATLNDFVNLLVTDKDGMSAYGLRLRPLYVKAVDLLAQGRKDEAVQAFEAYYLDKLQNPARYGISPMDMDPFLRGIGGHGQWPSNVFDASQPVSTVIASADELMQGKLGTIDIGLPGKVNWSAPYNTSGEIPWDKTPDLPLVSGLAFVPLVHAYIVTHDQKYLDQWNGYMRDWLKNDHYVDSLHPLFVSDGVTSTVGTSPMIMTRVLSALARTYKPDGISALDPELGLLIIKKMLTQEVLPSVIYIRSNTHNWTPSAGLFLLSTIFDEFRFSPLLFREARRRNIEDNAVTQNLRDGSENQQCPWYNDNYLSVARAITVIDDRKELMPWGEPHWIAPLLDDLDWRFEVRDHLWDHVNYFIHLRTPANEWPIPVRGGDKRLAGRGSIDASEDAYRDPVNQAILATVDARPGAQTPPYTSDWFPYGGYNIARLGWAKDSAYGALFASPKPGAYGGYRSRSNNNTFGLAAFGQDLLVDDCTGHYMYPSSPIRVDGKNQFYHEGIYKVSGPDAHKVYQVSAWTDPSPWRWAASDHFNLMEGVYVGAYGDPEFYENARKTYGSEEAGEGAPKPGDMIHGVAHQRLVFCDRESGLWIIVDRMTSSASHSYDQIWRIPLAPGASPCFAADDIKTDQAGKTISTLASVPLPAASPTKGAAPVGSQFLPRANMTMRQFTDEKLAYTKRSVPVQPRANGHISLYGWEEIHVAWTGSGASQIITAVLPRPIGSSADFQQVQELKGMDGVQGFSAVVPGKNGTPEKVTFLSASSGTGELKAGSISMSGECLLLSGSRGMALGCKTFSIDGATHTIPGPDFEFEIDGGKLANTTRIFRPISPVDIGPNENVFIDHIAVTMSSKTPGVEIHYTLDGTEPTPQSALYSGPVTLSDSTRIKARAYRPGVKQNPPDTSGTQATATSLAVFTKKEPEVADAHTKTLPGLKASYYEDDWKKLWLALDLEKPLAQAAGVKLWDYSVVPASNPAVGAAQAPRRKYYAVVYDGFLEVPEDGVYTFHAPRESVYPDTASGYDLRVQLGPQQYPFGPRTADYGLETWYPSTRLHAFGNWSVALKKGKHPFRLSFIDYRTDAASKRNEPNTRDYIWSGAIPDLKISGPNMAPQPIPDSWLSYAAK